MLISHTNQFLFVHIPRTGGASIAIALAPYADSAKHYLINRLLNCVGVHVNHYGPERMRRFRTHSSASVIRRHLSAETFGSLFKFTIVRNPWDRFVSYYHYVTNQKDHRRFHRVSSLTGFKEYLRYEVARGKVSQRSMLVDKSGRLLVDCVGRFECLQQDFESICQQLAIPCRLGHYNRSSHADYRQYDDESIELVQQHLADEIELFGYTFDGLADHRASDIFPSAVST